MDTYQSFCNMTPKKSLIDTMLRATLWTFFLCFPLAAITAAFYRFPIPFAAYESGFVAMGLALLAVMFYTAVGGFIVIIALGALTGAIAYKAGKGNDHRTQRLVINLSFLFALLCVLILANLDKMIGEW